MKSPSEVYLKGHNASGFKVGDKVRATRPVYSYELGWDWELIGCLGKRQRLLNKIGTIKSDRGQRGFAVRYDDGIIFTWPYFALELIESAEKWQKESWEQAEGRMARRGSILEEAIDNDNHYDPKPSGLCGYCPVITCKYNK